jgi:hypothetical protein
MRKLIRVTKAKKTAAAAGRATSNKAMENAITKLYDLSVLPEIVAGLDVHKEITVVTIVELDGVAGCTETKKFGTLKKDIDEIN